ncbi:hypothetical protein ACLMJK_001710 [Lecanora helva]
MRLAFATVLILAYTSATNAAVESSQDIAQHTDSVTSVYSLAYRHTGYVDQRVRRNPYTLLNHESWQQRKVVPTVPNTSLDPSNISSEAVSVDESSLLPDTSSLSNAANESSSNSAARLTDIPGLLSSTTMLQEDVDSDAIWDNQTEVACSKAVIALHGEAGNAAGLAACYNVRSYNNLTGMFEADLRLYQISSPSGKWTHLQASSETLDVVYTSAKITKSSRLQKREKDTVSLHKDHRTDSPHWQHKRSNGTPPRRIQGLTLNGQIGGDMLATTLNASAARSILLPDITFAGLQADGTSISSQLSTDGSSFNHGLFTDSMIQSNGSTPTTRNSGLTFETTLAVFPVGLIITGLWTLLIIFIEIYGLLGRIQARESYRKRVRSRMSGGLGGSRVV